MPVAFKDCVTDPRDVEIALRMVLAMEGVECRPQ